MSSIRYFLVMDFEATCERDDRTWLSEIIEFPAVLLDARSLEVIDEFREFVRPTDRPELTVFCTELTSIRQSDVANAATLDVVMKRFGSWLESHGLSGNMSSVLPVTCGDWDLKTMLPKECSRKGFRCPIALSWWCNIKVVFQTVFGKAAGMAGMLKRLNIKLEGRHHLGIDDSRNIAKILVELVRTYNVAIVATGGRRPENCVHKWEPKGQSSLPSFKNNNDIDKFCGSDSECHHNASDKRNHVKEVQNSPFPKHFNDEKDSKKKGRRWGNIGSGAVSGKSQREEHNLPVEDLAVDACIGPSRIGTNSTSCAKKVKKDTDCMNQTEDFTLTTEQKDTFLREGFLVLRPTVAADIHDKIISASDAAYEAMGYNGQQSSSPIGNNIMAHVPHLHTVFSSPEVDGALRTLLGNGYLNHPHRRPHQNDPGSRAQTLHKDSHFGFEFHRAHTPWWVMAMYYPQRVTPQSAPTSICPCTQYYAGEGSFDARHLEDGKSNEQLQAWHSREEPFICEAGTVVLLNNDIWHRGTANKDKFRRWMFCFMFLRTTPPPMSMPRQVSLFFDAQVLPGSHGALDLICTYLQGWLQGSSMAPIDVDVQAVAASLINAMDDQPRLLAAYALAMAADSASASIQLATVLRNATNEPLRRAAKFGAAAACHQQLRQGGTSQMVCELLQMLTDEAVQDDPGAASCAARALYEHGAWSSASATLRHDVAAHLAGAIRGSTKKCATRSAKSSFDVVVSESLPEHAGKLIGNVTRWLHARDFGFIRPSTGGEDVWVTSSAFGGGCLVEGLEVRFDIEEDQRTSKSRAVRVAGPAVRRSGGRCVGHRNVQAAALEALAVIPQAGDDPSTTLVATVLATEMTTIGQHAQLLVGDPSRQNLGEALMASTLGAVRLVSRCESSILDSSWWGPLRKALMDFVRCASDVRANRTVRRPGSGGTPGADNGLRYALAFALEALVRSGDMDVAREVQLIVPGLSASEVAPIQDALLFRTCHLTTQEQPF